MTDKSHIMTPDLVLAKRFAAVVAAAELSANTFATHQVILPLELVSAVAKRFDVLARESQLLQCQVNTLLSGIEEIASYSQEKP